MVKALVYESEIIAEMLVADTFLKRFLGFMFRREPHYEAILIKPCNSIHTFFMRFSIDVVFVNEDMEVVRKIEGLGLGKVVMPVNEAEMVIEGRAGLFGDIEVGDRFVVI